MRKKLMVYGLLSLLLLIILLSGCGGGSSGAGGGGVSISIVPAEVTLAPGGTQQFKATVSGTNNQSVTWAVDPIKDGGTIDTASGLYTAPLMTGKYYVIATSVADPSKSAKATVNVVAGGIGQRKYTGTINITKSGVTNDGDHYDETAELTGITIFEGAAGWWGSNAGINVDAYINDSIGDPPQVTVTFGPSEYQATMTTILLFINEPAHKYNLYINCIVENATMTDPEAGSFPYNWPIVIEPIENIDLPANVYRLIGTVNQNIDGVPVTITWDLTRN